MLIQMAGVFLFWWLLILGIGILGVFALEKFVLKPRREQARVAGPFAAILASSKPVAEPVQEAAPVVALAKSGESPGQRRLAFQAPTAEPRRYFIGKGPVEDEKA
jgi:hypothetical protein